MSEEEKKSFAPFELILYKHALEYKWTVEQLKKIVAMLRRPAFDSKEIDPDLHKRMEKAVLALICGRDLQMVIRISISGLGC
jgi:hypothetical protein